MQHRFLSSVLMRYCLVVMMIATTCIYTAVPATYAAPDDAPSEEIVVSTAGNYWTMNWKTTNSRIYWADYCPGGAEFRFPGELKYKILSTTYTKTLDTVSGTYCRDYLYMDADATGIYYLDEDESNTVKWVSASDPQDGPQTLYSGLPANRVPTRDIEISGEYLFWPTSNGLMRARKSGGSWSFIIAETNTIRDIVADENYVYWLSDNLYRVPVDCSACTPEYMGNPKGYSHSLTLHKNMLYVVDTISASNGTHFEEVQRILYRRTDQASGLPTLYQVPFGPGWQISNLATNDEYIFWFEYQGGGITLNYDARLRRMNLATQQVDTVAINLRSNASTQVEIQGNYVYYEADLDIRRLPINAARLSRDLVLDQWEVTQAVQNTANQAPLVAGKPTMVRVYGRQVTGYPVNSATVWLYGERNGTSLPGSPLKPFNGSQPMNKDDVLYNRENLNDSWNFELPDSWVSGGSINLRATLDPLNGYSDTTYANNTLTRSFTFNQKSPVCVRFYPIKTLAPKPTTYNNAAFWPMVELGEHLMPSRIDTYPQNGSYVKKGFWPFDDYFEPGVQWGDGGLINTALWVIDQTSDDPDECDDANAETHYAGMVHPKTNTTKDGKTLNGQGAKPGDQLWDKMPDPADIQAKPLPYETTYSWDNTSRISTLAHELGHNYGRSHVDCGGPDGTDDNYPYPVCQISPNNTSSYYGFNQLELLPITPTGARDIMAYGANRWVSDYTWQAFYNEFDTPNLRSLTTKQTAAERELQGANKVVFVSGVLDTVTNQAVLNPAASYPSADFSPRVQAKWLESAAISWDSALRGTGYHLQLLAANNQIIDDRAVVFDPNADGDETVQPFLMTFPEPLGTVEKVVLLNDTTVLAEYNVGSATPTIQLLEPSAGATIETSMTIRWTANDVDSEALFYTVQYSPDAGATWQTLATQLTASELALASVADLAGSTTAQVRVLASDGFHTAQVTSGNFTLAQQAPQPYISSPQPHQWLAAGQAIVLRGGASDAEDGVIPADGLVWKSGSTVISYDPEATIAGRYAPGEHTFTLEATDSTNTTAATSITFNIAPLSVPVLGPTTHDGSCNDVDYAAATKLPLRHSSGFFASSEGSVLLARSGDDLIICAQDLLYGTGFTGAPNDFVLSLDADNSRDSQTQANDYFVSVNHEGTFRVFQGNGNGYTRATSLLGISAETAINQDIGLWSAEIRIPQTVFNGWDHGIGLRFAYNTVGFNGLVSSYAWPISDFARPVTWAATSLQPLPTLTALSRYETTVGEAAWTLTVTGQDFSADSTVLWNEHTLTTSYLNSSTLTALVPTSLLNQAGIAEIAVDPGTGIATQPLKVMVYNPTPDITALSPDTTAAGATATTLSITGNNFVAGAVVIYGGEELPTTFINEQQLQATIPVAERANNRLVPVLVANPEPARAFSNTVQFTIGGFSVYLPTIQR